MWFSYNMYVCIVDEENDFSPPFVIITFTWNIARIMDDASIFGYFDGIFFYTRFVVVNASGFEQVINWRKCRSWLSSELSRTLFHPLLHKAGRFSSTSLLAPKFSKALCILWKPYGRTYIYVWILFYYILSFTIALCKKLIFIYVARNFIREN